MRFRKVVEVTLILLAVLAMGYALWGQPVSTYQAKMVEVRDMKGNLVPVCVTTDCIVKMPNPFIVNWNGKFEAFGHVYRIYDALKEQNMPVNKELAHGNGMVPNDKPVKDYKPTEVQLLRLQVTQKDAQLLQAQLQNIQRQFQEKVSQLMQEANKVKLEQGWSPDTVFDPDKLTFSAPPAKEAKK